MTTQQSGVVVGGTKSGKSSSKTVMQKQLPCDQFNFAMNLIEFSEDAFFNPPGQVELMLGVVADTLQLGVEFASGLVHAAVIAEELEQPRFRQDAAFREYLEHVESVKGWDHVGQIGRNYVQNLGERLRHAQEAYAKGDYFAAGELGNPLRPVLEIGTLGYGAVGSTKFMMNVSKLVTKIGSRGSEFTISGMRQFIYTHDFRSPITFQFERGIAQLNTGFPLDKLIVRTLWIKRDPQLQKELEQVLNNAFKGDGIARSTSAADALRLKAELAFKEAGFLDQDGRLTTKALEYTKSGKVEPLVKGRALRSTEVIKELTKYGQPIENWFKSTTKHVELWNGQNAQIHFYYNQVTREVSYSIDFKVNTTVLPFNERLIPKPETPFKRK